MALCSSFVLWRAEALESLPCAIFLVFLMMIGTSISQFGVIPRMDAIRASIPGEVDSVPADNSARAKFDALHKASTDIEGLILLMGLGALYLAG